MTQLFYSQIKRKFSPAEWRQGQIWFRQGKVQNVRIEGERIMAEIQSSGELPKEPGSATRLYKVEIQVAKGSLTHTSCTCFLADTEEGRCKHVAALSIWLVERGSLLRSGLGGGALGSKRQRQLELGKSAAEPEAPKYIQAEPVTFVRGVFESKRLMAVLLEPAIRFVDPETVSQKQPEKNQKLKVQVVSHLMKQDDSLHWRTPHGFCLELSREDIPILGSIHAAQLTYEGQVALDYLAELLGKSSISQIQDNSSTESNSSTERLVFHENLDVELDPEPLKLISIYIGKKIEKSRLLSCEFKNSRVRISSEELSAFAIMGKLSHQYVWKDDRIYRFETPLSLLSQYTHRTGAAVAEADGFTKLHDDAQHPLHPLAAYRLSLELGVASFVVDPEWVEFHEWRKQFEKSRIPTLPSVPYGFELRDYQLNGLSWLWSLYHRGLAALLADDMGLGKTHQVLALLTSIYLGKEKPKLPTLVVAPTSVVASWIHKLERYSTGLRWSVFHGKERVLPAEDINLVLTTYGILQREPILREKQWHIVILDEAQAIKNASTISSRASRVLKSKYRVAMTGTPVENQASDLWSILEFLIPGYLGSLPRFKRLYGSGRDASSQLQIQSLRRMVSPFLLRRTKQQVLKELPEKTEEIIACEMTEVQKKAYRMILNSHEANRARADLQGSGKIDYANILALLIRLKQACDHPKLMEWTSVGLKNSKNVDASESGKWEAFAELLNEALGSNLKVVVFTQYLGMIDLVASYLREQGIGYTELRGDTIDRGDRILRFADDANCKVFLCSLLAGSLGIDLTPASVCIHLDRWWNPARENQATDRLHRIGQTRGVQVFKLQIPGTIEDRIESIIQSKVNLSTVLIEESPKGLKSFSRKELLELLKPIEG